jgi:hypothetical protein
VGHVVVENQARWRASRLSVVQGTFCRDPDHYLPYSLQQYMNQCAMRCAEALASQSAMQKAKLRARLEASLPRLAGSEMFRAMRADVARSGSDAFAVTGDLSDSAAGTVENDIVEPHDA